MNKKMKAGEAWKFDTKLVDESEITTFGHVKR